MVGCVVCQGILISTGVRGNVAIIDMSRRVGYHSVREIVKI